MVDATRVLLAKKEVTYGVDSAPTGAVNAILTRNFSAKPVELDRLDRNLDQRIYGAQASVPSNERQTFSYEVEIAGSGAAGTAPRWMELLEGCGMAAPILTAGEDAVQAFAGPDADPTSLTQHHYVDDQRRRTVGSVGTFSFDFTAGAYPFFGFNWTGLLPAVPFDKSAPAAADLSDFIQPVEVNTANTDFTLGGYAAVLQSLRLNANVTVALRNLVGRRYVRRGNHALSGTALIEAPDIALKDYLTPLRNGGVSAMALTHGLADGNIIELAAGQVQITDITESVQDDILMWELAITLTVDGGLPDLTITAK